MEETMLDPKVFTFLKIVETQSFTKAADELGLTQPAVSQHISKLEQHYHQKLFVTSNRLVSLTPAGYLFYVYAKQQIANEKLLIDQLSLKKTKLHIGATLSIADYYLPDILSRMKEENLSEFEIQVGNTQTLLEKVVQGQLDGALVEGLFDQSQFESIKIHTEKFLGVVSRHHPLSDCPVHFHDLFTYPLILREKGSGTRDILDHYLNLQNYSYKSFKECYEFGSFVLIKQALMNSQAISFMYENVAKQEVSDEKLSFLDIQDYQLSHSFYFVYSKNTLKKENLIKLLKQFV